LRCEAVLEGNRLLEMKGFEIAQLGVGFEPGKRLRNSVNSGLAVAFCLFQIGEVLTLDPFVIRVVRRHDLVLAV